MVESATIEATVKCNDAEKYAVIFYTTSSAAFLQDAGSERIMVMDQTSSDKTETFTLNVSPSGPKVLFVQLQWVHEQEKWQGDVNLSLQHVNLYAVTRTSGAVETLRFLNGALTVTVKQTSGKLTPPAGLTLDAILSAAASETQRFSDAMQRMVVRSSGGRRPLMPAGAGYTESFAESANLFSALMMSSVHPGAFFAKKWEVSERVLRNLAVLALRVTLFYDGRQLTEEHVTRPKSAEERAMRSVWLSRFLAMYANCMPYMSDVEKRAAGGAYEVGEWFGDMILNQTGDCEDAVRVACQLWYALREYKGDDELLQALRVTSKMYEFYGALCTVIHLGNMAHMTAFLRRKEKFPYADDNEIPRVLVVEGTNMVDPFSATGGAPAVLRVDDTYVTYCAQQAAKMSGKYLKVVPKQRQAVLQAHGSVVDGRAGGSKKFYGIVHNVWSCRRQLMYVAATQGDAQHFGCSFEDIARGKMELLPINESMGHSQKAVFAQSRPFYQLEPKGGGNTQPFFPRSVSDFIHNGAFQGVPATDAIDALPAEARGVRVCLPYAQMTAADLTDLMSLSSAIQVYDVSCSTDRLVVAHVSYEVQHELVQKSIKGRVGEQAHNGAMVSADHILAPFVGHRGEIFPCHSLYATIAAQVHSLTGTRLQPQPNVCIREQVIAACGSCDKNKKISSTSSANTAANTSGAGDGGGSEYDTEPEAPDDPQPPDEEEEEPEFSGSEEASSDEEGYTSSFSARAAVRSQIMARMAARMGGRTDAKTDIRARMAARFGGRADAKTDIKARMAVRVGMHGGGDESAMAKFQDEIHKEAQEAEKRRIMSVYMATYPEKCHDFDSMVAADVHHAIAEHTSQIVEKLFMVSHSEDDESQARLSNSEINFLRQSTRLKELSFSEFCPYAEAMERGLGASVLPPSFWEMIEPTLHHHIAHSRDDTNTRLKGHMRKLVTFKSDTKKQGLWEKFKTHFYGFVRGAEKDIKRVASKGKKMAKKAIKEVEKLVGEGKTNIIDEAEMLQNDDAFV